MNRFHNTFSVGFYCRQSKTNKAGLAPIELGINIQGSRFFINTSRKGKPGKFFKDPETRDYLTTVEQRIYEWHTECIRQGKQPTKQALCEFIQAGYKAPGKCLKSLVREFYDSVDKRDITPSVVKKYHLVIDKFFAGVDMDQDAGIITKKMVDDYCISITKSYKTSTSAGMLTKFKSLWLFARDNGYTSINLCSGLKISKTPEEVVPLTEGELARIEAKHFDVERLERVKDIFLFSCYTGLSYCDAVSLVPGDFQVNDRGQTYLEKERAKTGIKYCVVMVPPALAILEKYGYQLPSISNQRMNSYLKEIQDICGISKRLHFHLARHTAACIWLNRYHFPVEIVGKLLGHSNIRTTQHYAKMWNNSVFDAFM